MNGKITYLNPDGLFKNPAYSQAVSTEGDGKTIYIGGQNAVNEKHEIIGKADIKAQTEQAMKNVQTALRACNADFENIIKMNIYLLQGQDAMEAFKASQKFMSAVPNPPVVTVVMVAALGNPDYLVEIDGIAFLIY